MHKPNRSFSQKVFAAGLAVTTALWAFGGLLTVAGAVEAHPAGTLVLSGSTVWHISDDGSMRHGVDSLAKFLSNRYSFANVVPANSADLALPDGGLLGWGSGVLFNDAGTVYQVSGGMKHGFTSAAAFTGSGFSFANVVNASLAGVPAGSNISDASMAHKEGTFVVSSGTVWRISATGRTGIPQPGVLYSWGAGFKDVVAANSADLALANEGNATFRAGALVNDAGTLFAVTATGKRGFPSASCYTGFGFNFSMPVVGSTAGLTTGANYCADTVVPPGTPPTPPPTSAGTLSVSLASDTPAATTVVENAARVPFTKVNFTAGASDVIIDSMVVERTGLSVDSNFTDILLLDVTGTTVGQASQIGNEKSLGSTHMASLNDDITVKAGTTKSLMIAANMSGTLQAGEQASLRLNSVTLAGTATLSGSLPITGNQMTMNGTLAIGALTVAAGSYNPSATTQNVGATDFTVAGVSFAANSVEDIQISQVRFYQNGTAADSDVANLELLQDSLVVATVAAPTSKEVLFKLASPITIPKGETRQFALRLDITDGSSRTISFDFEKKTDVVALGKTYGYYVTPTYPNTTAPYYNAPDTTIDEGTLTFSKGVVASLNVGEGTSNQVLGAFKVTVQGEPVRVTRFVIGVTVTGTGTTSDITNMVIRDESGAVVAGPFDPAASANANISGSATTTDTIVFPVGTKTYTINGNLNTDFATNDTIALRLSDPDGLITAKGEVTNQTVTPSPTTDLALDTITVKAGSLSVSTQGSPAAQTVVIGTQDHVFANYVLDAGSSGEDVRVNSLLAVHKTAVASTQTNITNLEILIDGVVQPPSVSPTVVADTTATSTFSFTSPIVIAKGTSKILTLRGDVNAGTATTHTHAFGCNGAACISATGATTGNTVAATVTNSDGQIMTLATTGSLTVAGDPSTPNNALITGAALKATVQVLNVTASQEQVDLKELMVITTGVNSGAANDELTMVYLFDGATQIASAAPTTTGSVTFANIPSGTFRVTPGTAKKLTVKVDAGAVVDPSNAGSATADSGQGITFSVAEDGYGATGVSSGANLAAASISGNHTANTFTIMKSVPTVSQLALPTNTLANIPGIVLYKFKVAADAKGDIALYQFSFAISTSTATVTQFQLWEEPSTSNEVNLTNNANRTVNANTAGNPPLITAVAGISGQYAIKILFDTGTDGVGNGGEFRTVLAGASKTFELRGTVASSVTGSTVSVVMMGDNAFPTTYPACAGLATAGGAQVCSGIADIEQGKFVWSDLAFASASTSATNSPEWFNGFRVAGMTTTSTALTLSR